MRRNHGQAKLGRFLGLGLGLLLVLVFLASLPGIAYSDCLPEAVSSADRVSLDNGDPFGLWDLTWDSAMLAHQVLEIIVEEQLGIEVVHAGSSGSSRVGVHALGDCYLDGVFYCKDGMYDPVPHALLEAWMSQTYNQEWFMENYPDRAPISLGSIGYTGLSETFLSQSSKEHGMAERGDHLEYYGEYNVSWRVAWESFDHYSNISQEMLMPCSDSSSSLNIVEDMARVIKFAPDPEGFTEDGVAYCEDGYWWLSPACRDIPERCIPWVSGGYGWNVYNVMQRAIAYSMPLAVAVAADWTNYVLIPRTYRALFYHWTPALHFTDIEPVLVVFPAHDAEAYELGDERTAKSQVKLWKLVHQDLETIAPNIYTTISAMTFTITTIEDMLDKVFLGESYEDVACEWMLANEATWQAWLPVATECAEGTGLINSTGDFVGNRSTASGCSACIAGYYSTDFSDDVGDTQLCEPCAPGTAQAMWGSSECTDCEVGYYQDATGKSSCERCGRGEYSNETGQTVCQQCPSGRTTDGTGYHSVDDCLCPSGSYMNGLGACIECRDEATCEGFGASPMAKKGHQLWAIEDSGLSLFVCSNALRCPGGGIQECAEGREGIACAQCKPHMKSATDGSCSSCEAWDKGIFVVTTVVLVAGLSWSYIFMMKQDKARQTFELALLTTMFSQFLSILQLMGVLARLSVEWEEPVRTMMQILAVFSFDVEVLRLACVVHLGNAEVYIWKLSSLPLAIAYLLVFHFLFRKGLCRQNPLALSKALISSIGVVFMAFFVTISTTVFMPFQCIQHPNERWTVLQFESQECWAGGAHTTMLVAACFGMILPFGFIAEVVRLLTIFPRRLQHGDIGFLNDYSFLFARVKPNRRWYAIFVLGRNLVVALILMVPNAFWQVFLMQSTFCTSLCVTLVWQPWSLRSANRLDLAATALILLLFTLSAFFTTSASTDSLTQLTVVVGCGAILAIPGSIIWLLVVTVLKRPKHFAWFLCHQKMSSGNLARLLKMIISDCSQVNVFLDSDDLHDLGSLFEIVKSNTRSVVVLATRPLLGSPWCMGEVATAYLHEVYTVPVIFTDFSDEASAHRLEWQNQLADHPDFTRLSEAGISMDDIDEAIRRFEELQQVCVEELSSMEEAKNIAQEIMSCARKSMQTGVGNRPIEHLSSFASVTGRRMPSREIEAARTMIFVDLANREGVAAGLVLAKLLAPLWLHEPSKIPVVMEEVSDWEPDFAILMLTSACFSSTRFLEDLVWLAGKTLQALVPVAVNDSFEFPCSHFYEDLKRHFSAMSCLNVEPEAGHSHQHLHPQHGARTSSPTASASLINSSAPAVQSTPSSLLDASLIPLIYRSQSSNLTTAQTPSPSVTLTPHLMLKFVEAIFERICKRLSVHSGIESLMLEAGFIQREVESGTRFRNTVWKDETVEARHYRGRASSGEDADFSGSKSDLAPTKTNDDGEPALPEMSAGGQTVKSAEGQCVTSLDDDEGHSEAMASI